MRGSGMIRYLGRRITMERDAFIPYRPEGTGSTHGHTMHVNALECRGREFLITKLAGTFRTIGWKDCVKAIWDVMRLNVSG